MRNHKINPNLQQTLEQTFTENASHNGENQEPKGNASDLDYQGLRQKNAVERTQNVATLKSKRITKKQAGMVTLHHKEQSTCFMPTQGNDHFESQRTFGNDISSSVLNQKQIKAPQNITASTDFDFRGDTFANFGQTQRVQASNFSSLMEEMTKQQLRHPALPGNDSTRQEAASALTLTRQDSSVRRNASGSNKNSQVTLTNKSLKQLKQQEALRNFREIIQTRPMGFIKGASKLPMCDLNCMRDPQSVVEVSSDILANMIQEESLYQPSIYCVSQIQTELTERMRGLLLAWLVEVHIKFKLLPETLFITVNLIDRFTERVVVKRNEYQLVGVTAMLIASKYEEIHPPVVADFEYITDNCYTRQQILQQECLILQTLGFDIQVSTSNRMMERFFQLSNLSKDTEACQFASYLAELCLIDSKMNKWKPSQIATACIFLTKKILKRAKPWCATMQEHSKYREKQVRECAHDICIILNNVTKKKNYETLFKKYSASKYGRVAQIPIRLREEAIAQNVNGKRFDDSSHSQTSQMSRTGFLSSQNARMRDQSD